MNREELKDIIREELRLIVSEGKYLGNMYPGSDLEDKLRIKDFKSAKTVDRKKAVKMAQELSKKTGLDTYIVFNNISNMRDTTATIMIRKK